MSNRPEYMTLRYLLELLKKQQGDNFEAALDTPLFIGIYDGNRNFDHGHISIDYPKYNAPYNSDFKGSLRIDCHTSNKRLVEKSAKQKA